jgi:hypothetical protein
VNGANNSTNNGPAGHNHSCEQYHSNYRYQASRTYLKIV